MNNLKFEFTMCDDGVVRISFKEIKKLLKQLQHHYNENIDKVYNEVMLRDNVDIRRAMAQHKNDKKFYSDFLRDMNRILGDIEKDCKVQALKNKEAQDGE